MRIPDDLKKSVVFILREDKPDTWNFVGTGFFVSKKMERIPGRSFAYLVTAKHVVVALKGHRFAVRINKKEGGSELLIAETDGLQWYDHPNHGESPSDVSVIRMPIIQTDHLDFRAIPTEMFLKKEEMETDVGAGDEVYIIGLFANLFGKERNSPLVRVGNIAMAPEDKVPTNDFGDMEAYLIEARSLGGISGSPVFTMPSKIVIGGSKRLYCMGLVHGHWDIPIQLGQEIAPQDEVGESDVSNRNHGVNMGIAIVTPAFKILETIEHPELASQAKEQEERMIQELSTKKG